MWNDLVGTWAYASGSSGTVTVPVGARIVQVMSHSTAGGTITMFGGSSIPVVAGVGFSMYFMHSLNTSQKSPNNTIVFTSTDIYYVEYVTAGNY